MDDALATLASYEEQDFLRVTATALKILQNIQNEPSEEKYRRLRKDSAVRMGRQFFNTGKPGNGASSGAASVLILDVGSKNYSYSVGEKACNISEAF